MAEIRTRFAPSPTGYLHVGGARTALYNYLYARARGGTFILRIEDTDQERSTETSLQQLIESLQWLGLDWDEGQNAAGEEKGKFGPYRQSHRLDIYREYIGKLLQTGHAYRCFCSEETLAAKKEHQVKNNLPQVYDGTCRGLTAAEGESRAGTGELFTVRVKVPDEKIAVEDIVQGRVEFDGAGIGDYIIARSDGFPTYNFVVVIDDHLMEITHVIRGVGHLSNTPRQIAIYRAFGWTEPAWAHISEIVGSDRKKLSKRHGATSITAFRDLGYPPEAFINFITLLGWAPSDEEEFMPFEKIRGGFDIVNCHKNPAMFDIFKPVPEEVNLAALSPRELIPWLTEKSKLNWLSNLHIRAKAEKDFLREILPFVRESGIVSAADATIENQRLCRILLSLRPYLDFYAQISALLPDFWSEDDDNYIRDDAGEWLKKHEFFRSLFGILERLMGNTDEKDWTMDAIKHTLKQAGTEAGLKGKDLFMTLRAGLTGKTEGMDLAAYIELLGRRRIINRSAKLAQGKI